MSGTHVTSFNRSINSQHDYFFKVILLGESSVGKTSLLKLLEDDVFMEDHQTTVGIDCGDIIITSADGKKVKLQVWDTSGQERFDSITRNYYRGSDGVIFMCDVSQMESVPRIRKYYDDIKHIAGKIPPAIILCNKIDLKHKKQIIKKVTAMSKTLKIEPNFVSVKNNFNIIGSLGKIVSLLINNIKAKKVVTSKSVKLKLEENEDEKKKCSC